MGMFMTTRKFIWDDTKPGIEYRPATSDESIIQTVLVEQREYMFPTFKPSIIYDMGGNIGVLAVIMANVYPDAMIYSFEPVRENFDLLVKNTATYKNVFPLNYGLGEGSGMRNIWKSDDEKNLGGFSTIIQTKGEDACHLVRIRDIGEVVREYGHPDLIKVDVEGAEAEILHAMPLLERVKWIAGELHGIRDFEILDLLSKNFHIQTARNFTDKVWHFHAVNKSCLGQLDSPLRLEK
jgi:FkbM family methyltransferase